MKAPANIAASVRQRLLNLARERGEDFQQILVRYALERLLYRLAQSPHRDRFVLKGALLFRLWFDLEQRATRDADFLGFGEAEPEHCAAVFRAIAAMEGEAEDGLVFDTASVRAGEIRKEAGYPGVRVSMTATFDGARIPVQCDIGFGDAITPAPLRQAYPTLLDMPAPVLAVYPLETVGGGGETGGDGEARGIQFTHEGLLRSVGVDALRTHRPDAVAGGHRRDVRAPPDGSARHPADWFDA